MSFLKVGFVAALIGLSVITFSWNARRASTGVTHAGEAFALRFKTLMCHQIRSLRGIESGAGGCESIWTEDASAKQISRFARVTK